MDFEFDSTTSGVFIALLVSVVSVVLYCMFKPASFASRNPSPAFSSAGALSKKRKGKKNDTKKQKQVRKHKRDGGLDEEDANDETEEDVNLETPDGDSAPLPSPDTDDEIIGSFTLTEHLPEPSKHPFVLKQRQSSDVDGSCVPTSDSHSPKEVTVQLPKPSPSELTKNVPLLHNLSNSEDSDGRLVKEGQHEEEIHEPFSKEQLVSSKKKKRRNAKVHSLVNKPTECQLSKIVPLESEIKITNQLLTTEAKLDSQDNPMMKFLRIEVDRLLAQLKTTQNQLDEKSKRVAVQAEENVNLRKKEEETSLGLRVLREQYTELLRTNKGLDHEKSVTTNKLNILQNENDQLVLRLESFEDNANQYKQKIKQLLDRLKNTENKLATALANVAPPDPLPEIVRAQEIAQQNLRLTTCLEQKDNEMGQLRQANAIQQKEIQTLHETITEKNTRLQELRMQIQVEQTEFNSRIATSEAELQRCCQEYECEKQDMARQLTKALSEAAVYREQEKRHMDTINSLQYQFSELNAHQHRLIGQASSEKAANDSRIGGLQAELANTHSQLVRVTNELTAVEQRCASLRSQLEHQEDERQAKRWSPVPVETSNMAISTDDSELADRQASVSSQPPSVEVATCRDGSAAAQLESARLDLDASKAALKNATSELIEAREKQRATDEQLRHYKTTLVQTEDTLAKLQAVAESSEANWKHLLTDSQESEAQLRSQLTAAVLTTNQTVAEVKCLEQRLVDGQMMVQRLQLELEQLKSDVRSQVGDTAVLEMKDKSDQQTGLSSSPEGDAGADRPSQTVTPEDAVVTSDVDSDEVLVDHADLCVPYTGDR